MVGQTSRNGEHLWWNIDMKHRASVKQRAPVVGHKHHETEHV